MNKKILIVISAALLLGTGAYFLFINKKEEVKVENPTQEKQEEDKGREVRIPENETEEPIVREIRIMAKNFEYSQSVINVKKGEKIRIIVEDTEGKHGIMIPELIHPPTQESFSDITFTAEKEGTFEFYCPNENCGFGHGKMKGKIVVS